MPCAISGVYVNDTKFRFLNVEADLFDEESGIDWSAAAEKRLWRYNLHYFDFLRESVRPPHNKEQLIHSWIAANPQGTEPGWEPFTTSLRIVNWIFYMLQRPAENIPRAWLDSLYLQSLWLERNDERHILANHYFENLKALLFAGCFFDGIDATRWLNRTIKEIRGQIREQTLSDGGHYERSHQYHCLMLENYLDICTMSRTYPGLCPSDFVEQVQSTAAHGMEWLSATLFPDGQIPLFNDSAFGIAIPPGDLFEYAERLSLDVKQRNSGKLEIIDRPQSGFYGCRVGDDMFIIDCGEIGPHYQPGHTHCDFLSYELMLSNQRVVVDTGVCEYEPGPLRSYLRSTKAHNTVSVDGGDQSEIWDAFRVARRAKKNNADITIKNEIVEFRGAFEGFYNIRNRIKHHRNVSISLSADRERIRKLIVTDQVIGSGHHEIESFIHLHPDIAVRQYNEREVNLLHNGSEIASIKIPGDQDCSVAAAIYCPEFGKQISSQMIRLRVHGNLPLSSSYEIRVGI